MRKQFLRLLLAFAMLLCLMPAAAMAAPGDPEWITHSLGTEGYIYDSAAKTLTITSDAHMTWTLQVPETLTLDLNGHTLTGAASRIYAVEVASGTTLTVTSTGGEGKLLASDVGYVYVGEMAVGGEGSVVIAANVTVQGGNTTDEHGMAGAAIACHNATIYGTVIGGNATGEMGRGGHGVTTTGSVTLYGTAIGGTGGRLGGYGVRAAGPLSSATVESGGAAIGGNSSHNGGHGVCSEGYSGVSGNGIITIYGTAMGGYATAENGKSGDGARLDTSTADGSITIKTGGTAIGANGNTPGLGAHAKDAAQIVIEADSTVIDGSQHTGEISADDMSITYGDTDKNIKHITNGNGAVSYTVKTGSDVIEVDANGHITTKKVGTATVKVSLARTYEYSAAETEMTVTVNKATVTIKPHDKSALVGDTAPTLGAEDYTVTGLASGEALKTKPTLFYATVPDMRAVGTTAIKALGAEVPDGGNYHTAIVYVDGTLNVTAAPVTLHTLSVVGGTGSGEYAEGETVNIEAAAPAPGKQFKNWTSTGGGSFADANSAATRFTMPASNATVTANYEDIPAAGYTISVSASPAAGGTVSGGGSFAANASVNVTATPKLGYRFVKWMENGNLVSTAAKYSFTATANRNLVAVFEAIPTIPTGGGTSGGIGSIGGYIAPTQNRAQNAAADIWISGMNIPSGDVLITPTTQNSALMRLLGGNTLVGMWDIKLRSGRTNIPGSTLSFNVGRENAGKIYTLYHQKADGTVEKFSATADTQGIVSFYPINELSPFMLVQGGGIVTTSIAEVPATGDVNVGLAMLLLSAMMAAAVVLMKRRKVQA